MTSSEGIEKFVRPELASLGGYSAHKSPDTLKNAVTARNIIKLDANENPYGCSPKVPQVLSRYGQFHIYPDSKQTRLRQLLQRYCGAEADSIVASNGSGELLDYILCLFLEPGDEVINSVPTFDLYRLRTVINRGKVIEVPRNEDFSLNVKAVKSAITARTKLIILANPNNPTGNATPAGDIAELADSGLPLLIDEAYYEFCGETAVPMMGCYPNLMVLRTFSKWTGLAGLRLGYGIFPPKIVQYLMKIKLPYNVNVAALAAAEESLNDINLLQGRVKAIISERERLFSELKKLDFLKPLPSRTNFILCRVLKGEVIKLQQQLLEEGVVIRCFSQPRLQNTIRISVGRPEDTDVLIKILRQIGGKTQ